MMGPLEKIFTVFVLFLSTGALIPLLHQEGGSSLDPFEGDPVMQALWTGIYGVTLILISRIWRRTIRIWKIDKFLVLLIMVALLSFFWSDAPSITLRRCVALLGTTVFGVYLTARYTLREQLQLLGWALGICAVLSFLFALVVPSLGISSGIHEGAWRGIYVHKNVLGRLMVLCILVSFLLFQGRGNDHQRLFSGVLLVLSVCLLVLSVSKTALVLFISFLMLVPFFRALRLNYRLLLIYLLVVVGLTWGLVGWLLSHTEELASSLGRDMTLTGRTNLWPIVVEMIKERPLFGFGYNAFWLGWQGESRYVWLTSFEAVHAHNGYLDLTLDLGLLGLGVFIAGFFLNFLRALMSARNTETMEGLWPVLYLTFMLLYNITESSILTRNGIFWILYVATALTMSLDGARERSLCDFQ